MSIITLAQAKAQLNIPDADTADNDEIQEYVDAITGVIEDYKHEVIESRQFTERVRLNSTTRRFRLWRLPIISIDDIKSLDGQTTYSITGLYPDPDTGLIDVDGATLPDALVNITYTAGYSTVPANYVQGALVALQDAWETQRGVGGVSQGVTSPEEEHNRAAALYTTVRRTRQWLGPPRPVVG